MAGKPGFSAIATHQMTLDGALGCGERVIPQQGMTHKLLVLHLPVLDRSSRPVQAGAGGEFPHLPLFVQPQLSYGRNQPARQSCDRYPRAIAGSSTRLMRGTVLGSGAAGRGSRIF